MSSKRKPSYLLHRATGQARVRIKGKDHYLGAYGSTESRERYDDLIAEWFDHGDTVRVRLALDDLALLYIKHAEQHYRKHGRPTSELSCIKTAIRYVVRLHGTTRVRDFGPRALKAVRETMVVDGHCRRSINKHVGRIRRMFRWGVENEYVPSEIYGALVAVQGLQQGRSAAIETNPVMPVPAAHIEAVKPYVSPPVWGLIRLQLLTGMRPGEALSMRACNLNTSGKIWEYMPSEHKSEHYGRQRIIFIGPHAQAVLRPFLKRETQVYLFSPRDVRPVTEGRTRQPGERYDRDAYRNAIKRACIRAGVPCWHPNRLRHNAATLLRREAGIETARVVLGHTSAAVTELYAERDLDRARQIMANVG
jgi:integrase